MKIRAAQPRFRALLVSHVGVYRPDPLCTTSINQSSQAADAANISHATAYRYFPTTQSLWTGVAVGQTSVEHLTADLPDDVGDRVELVIRRITHMQFADEALWRRRCGRAGTAGWRAASKHSSLPATHSTSTK